ncbi:MAG: patatin-like phospholipase family protein [Pseudomonadales bacterium]|nr:patatin-like phospholipase family protein [Pseudomonadales bacterium]
MLLSDLEIPFEAVVAGVNRGAIGVSPEEYAREHRLILDKMPSKVTLGRKITAQLIRMLAFINPMITKEIIIGGDSLTADFDAVDAAGFSSAIPGILHYDIARNDTHMTELLEELFLREELMCLVDGGIINNVPVRTAWNQVQDGKIGTRNCYYLGFDCFHPQMTLGHALTLPVEYALQAQVSVNHPFAHKIIKFKPTLSPANLVPSPSSIDKSYDWGYKQMKEDIPLMNKFFEPVEWPKSQP